MVRKNQFGHLLHADQPVIGQHATVKNVCCRFCSETFATAQGAGSHERNRHSIELNGSGVEGLKALAASFAGGGAQALPLHAGARATIIKSAPKSNVDLVDLTRSDLRTGNHGAQTRMQYTVRFKCRVIAFIDEPSNIRRFGAANIRDVAVNLFRVRRPNIDRWMQHKVAHMAHRDTSLFHVSPQRAAMFARAEGLLLQAVLAQREKTRPVTALFLQLAMRRLVAELYPEEDLKQFKFSNMWVLRFARRNNLSRRVANNCKHTPTVERLPIIQRFHQELRTLFREHTEHPQRFEESEEEAEVVAGAGSAAAVAAVDAYPIAGKRKGKAPAVKAGVVSAPKAARAAGALASAFAKARPAGAVAYAEAGDGSGSDSDSSSSDGGSASDRSSEADLDSNKDPNDPSTFESLEDFEAFGVQLVPEPPAAVDKSLVGKHILRYIDDVSEWNYMLIQGWGTKRATQFNAILKQIAPPVENIRRFLKLDLYWKRGDEPTPGSWVLVTPPPPAPPAPAVPAAPAPPAAAV